MTFKLSTIVIQSIQNYLCWRIYDVFNSNGWSKCLRYDFAECKIKLNSPRDPLMWWPSFPSSLPKFFTVTNSRTVQLKNCRANSFHRLNSNIECVNAFAGTLQISLPTGLSRQAQCETNFNFPAPPFNHISGIW